MIYDVPKTYLKAAQDGVGDWAVYYAPVKAGQRGYFAVARIMRIKPKPGVVDRFLARIEPGSYLPFDHAVSRRMDGQPLESALTAADGSPKAGGAQRLAVRRLPDREFARIVSLGLPQDLETTEARRYDSTRRDIDEGAATFERPVLERLTRRP